MYVKKIHGKIDKQVDRSMLFTRCEMRCSGAQAIVSAFRQRLSALEGPDAQAGALDIGWVAAKRSICL